MIETPILIILYNRVNITRVLFETLEKNGFYKSIYISIDGPKDNESDRTKVNEIINLINKIKFARNIFVNINQNNLGCKLAVSSGISWFFDNVNEGIILEDDCLPSPEFFVFMEKMLKRYRNDNRIAQISGYNTLGSFKTDSDYLYSNFGSIWGWATWKRSWSKYDISMDNYFNNYEMNYNLKRKISFYFDSIIRLNDFSKAKKCKVDTWDFQWMFTRLSQNMLSVIPCVTLIQNVGIGEHATHTFSKLKQHDQTYLNFIRKNVDWEKPHAPNTMLPNYLFEFKITEYKRGLKGMGPLYLLKKIIKISMNKFNIFK